MNVYAVITARAGSQRVPGKNRELLPYSMLFLNEVLAFDSEIEIKLIITSDDPVIESWASRVNQDLYGGIEYHFVERPAELASGASKKMHRQAIHHAVKAVAGWEPGIGILLQPTSPFRRVRDFVKVVDALANTPAAWIGSIQTVYDKTHEENGNLYGFRWPPIVEEPGDWLRAAPRCYLPQGQRESFQVDTLEDMEMFRKLTA